MLMNIWVKDNMTGHVHQVGTDPHDSLEFWDGKVEYVNQQCMEGTKDGAYSFVKTPDVDDYVTVTPNILQVNREYLHRDVLKMIEEHPEMFEEVQNEHEKRQRLESVHPDSA